MYGDNFINVNAMDEAIALYEKEKRDRFEEHLIDCVKVIESIYKKEHPTGSYLCITIGKEGIMINNDYWNDDADFPIRCDNLFGEIRHLPVSRGESIEEDE